MNSPALVVVDMQRYYLDSASTFSRFHERIDPGCLAYIHERCRHTVIPNTHRLIRAFEAMERPVIYLRLCAQKEDRSDLHQTFASVHREAEAQGFSNLYPLVSDPFSRVVADLESNTRANEFCKTTYSAFTSSPEFVRYLKDQQLETLVFTGLATSQCVETTARDAADRNYHIIHVDDAQADYSDTSHRASLYSSQGVCGGHITITDALLEELHERMEGSAPGYP